MKDKFILPLTLDHQCTNEREWLLSLSFYSLYLSCTEYIHTQIHTHNHTHTHTHTHKHTHTQNVIVSHDLSSDTFLILIFFWGGGGGDEYLISGAVFTFYIFTKLHSCIAELIWTDDER